MDSREVQGRDEIDLWEFFAPLLARWKLLVVWFVICAGVVFGVSRMLPKTYQSTAVIFVQQSSSPSSLLKNLPITVTTSNTASGYIVTLLQSESLLGKVIRQLGLLRRDDFTCSRSITLDEALERLRKQTGVLENKNGSISISVRANSPTLAADIANSMVDSLGPMVITASRRKADFIADRLSETNRDLREAEHDLVAFLDKNDVAAIDEQTKGMIDQMVELEGRTLTLDEQLESVNSELKNAGDLDTLVGLEVKKRSIESSRAYVAQKREELRKKLSDLPAIAAGYAAIQRRVAVLNTTFQLLTEQYQLARITQKGEDGDYQIVDRARPNPKKVAPRPAINGILGGMVGVCVASVGIHLRLASKRRNVPRVQPQSRKPSREPVESTDRT